MKANELLELKDGDTLMVNGFLRIFNSSDMKVYVDHKVKTAPLNLKTGKVGKWEETNHDGLWCGITLYDPSCVRYATTKEVESWYLKEQNALEERHCRMLNGVKHK